MYYVVSEVGFDYNDEIYSVSGSNYGDKFGTPVKVFSTREKANDFIEKKTVKVLKGLELGQYFYDLNDILRDSDECFVAFWQQEFGQNLEAVDRWAIKVPEEATDGQLRRLAARIKLPFFTLTEVEES